MKKQWKALANKRAAKKDARNKRKSKAPKSNTFGGRRMVPTYEVMEA